MALIDQKRPRGDTAKAGGSSLRRKPRVLRDRSVRTRVAALVLLPLMATVVLGAIVVEDSLDEAAEAVPAQQLTEVGVEATEIARQLRNERFAIGLVETNPSDANMARVERTRADTDAAIEEYFAAREPLNPRHFGFDIENTVRTFEWEVAEIEDMREEHDAGSEDVNLQQYYTDLAGLAEQISIDATDIIVRQRELGPTLVKAVEGAHDAANRARIMAIISTAVVVVVLGFTVAMTTVVARSLIGPLRRLRAAALDTAKTNLPALVDRIQRDGPAATRQAGAAADVESEDEIGQVAAAFNDVHATAVRVAGEQALLRQNLDTIVVNLSRRTQSLIDRQLGELEGLESRERDPDQLSTLFRIDHMATRVRRHADSLLILAGVEEMRKQVPASPVLDVVRGAVGEVEQYARVEFGVMPADLVIATAVHDTAHLLAELIDNATEFSAPSTPVTVTSQPLLGGGLRIQVTDTGLGIPPDQLTELNTRLTSPGDIDVAASRTLGLYVVARLSAKHGVQVRLEPGAATGTATQGASGTVAQVDLPSSLILSPLDTTEDVISAIQNVDAAANGIGQNAGHYEVRPEPHRPIARPEYGQRLPQQPQHMPAQQQQPSPKPAPRPAPPAAPPQRGSAQPVARNDGPRPAQQPGTPLSARDQARPARSLSVSKPESPRSETPMYDAVRSAWFSRDQKATEWRSPADEGWLRAAEAQRAAEAAAAVADNRITPTPNRPVTPPVGPPAGSPRPPAEHRAPSPTRPQAYPAQQPDRQHASSASLWTQNRPSQPANPPPATAPTPAANPVQGLPVRQKGASLLPGSISDRPQEPEPSAPTSQPPADVKRVASTLSSLQRGVSRGREETGGWVPKRPGGPERSNS